MSGKSYHNPLNLVNVLTFLDSHGGNKCDMKKLILLLLVAMDIGQSRFTFFNVITFILALLKKDDEVTTRFRLSN